MAVRNILKIGDPQLREVSEMIDPEEIRTKEFKKLIRDMFDTMKHADGVGLAAPQIGVLKKIVVVGSEQDNERYPEEPEVPQQILINPEITPLTDETLGFWEGCLSVPGMRGYVERPSQIRAKWMDEQGEMHEETISGFRAVVFQHECDHLDGVLYVDRLKDTKMFGYIDSIPSDQKVLD